MKCIKSKKNNIRRIFKIILISVICITLGICIYILYNYNQAKTEQKNNNYEVAISYYQKIEFINKVKEQENECYYQKAIELRNEKKYDNSILYFKKINNYNDSQEQIKETKYQQALYSYNMGDFKKTKEILETMPEYKETSKYLDNNEKMIELQGIWEKPDNCSVVYEIVGWKLKCYIEALGTTNYIINNRYFYSFLDAQLEINNNEIKLAFNNGKNSRILNYDKNTNTITDNVGTFSKQTGYKVEKIPKKQEPQIGMSKTEVENSAWGKPDKINRTRTSYGTHEQWCYSNNKYIYFEDGIVTSIQD